MIFLESKLKEVTTEGNAKALQTQMKYQNETIELKENYQTKIDALYEKINSI